MSNIWSKEETLWSFALYGTAVGAGTLFLPIQLGSAGAVVLFITALVAWPLTYWPHKALCQFILSSKTSAGEGITGAVTHYYGKKIGNLITTLYFIAFFVVVLIYAVAITNSLTEQLAKKRSAGAEAPVGPAAETAGEKKPSPDAGHASTIIRPFDDEFRTLLENTIDDAADDSGWASLGDVGSVLSKKMPDFDPRNYGYKKLSLLVRALSDAVDMKTEQQRVYVRNRVG